MELKKLVMKTTCYMIYSIPVGQCRIVANTRKYFQEFNLASVFKCLEHAPLPLGIWKFCLAVSACLQLFFLEFFSYTSQVDHGTRALHGSSVAPFLHVTVKADMSIPPSQFCSKVILSSCL